MSRKVIPFSGNNSSNMKNTFSPITSSSFPLLSTSLVIIQLNFSPHPTTRKKCIHAVPTIVKQEQPLSQHLLHHDCHDMYIMLPYFFCLFSFVQVLLYKKKSQKILVFLDLCIGKNATVTHYINGAKKMCLMNWVCKGP